MPVVVVSAWCSFFNFPSFSELADIVTLFILLVLWMKRGCLKATLFVVGECCRFFSGDVIKCYMQVLGKSCNTDDGFCCFVDRFSILGN